MFKTLLFSALALLMVTSVVQAQYRWRVVQPAMIDTFFYDYSLVSCNGNSCVVLGGSWNRSLSVTSSFSLTSSDAGVTWIKHELTFGSLSPEMQSIQMIDSLNVYAISSHYFWSSSDGGVSWIPHTLVDTLNGFPTNNVKMNFFNSKEGVVCTNTNNFYTTSDGGGTWDTGHIAYSNPSACKAYGNGKFRILSKNVYTTMDYGKTTSSSFMTYAGFPSDTGFHISFFELSGGDTMMAFCVHANPPGSEYHDFIYISSDTGQHWVQSRMSDTMTQTIDYAATSADSGTIFVGNFPPTVVTFSTDHGASWQNDSTVQDDSLPFGNVLSFALTGAQTGIAIIQAYDIDTIITSGDTIPISGSALAMLEPITSHVTPVIPNHEFNLYPNPAVNVLTITNASRTLSILDPLGRAYSVPTSTAEDGHATRLDVSSLPSGIYFLTDGAQSAKFVKE